MKKKSIFLLSLLPLFVSCSKIPDDIYLFLKDLDVNKAMEAVNTASVSYEMEIHNSDTSENLGTMTFQLKMDKSNVKDYFCYYEETFSGQSVLLDTESSLYVDSLSSHTFWDEKDQLYYVETYKYGHKEGSETKEEYYKRERYLESDAKILYQQVFYRDDNGYVLSSGLYYGSTMQSLTNYVALMRVEGDTFIYQYDRLYYKDDEEEGTTSCKAVMNNIGMIITEDTAAENWTTKVENSSKLEAIYNEEVTRSLSFE